MEKCEKKLRKQRVIIAQDVNVDPFCSFSPTGTWAHFTQCYLWLSDQVSIPQMAQSNEDMLTAL